MSKFRLLSGIAALGAARAAPASEDAPPSNSFRAQTGAAEDGEQDVVLVTDANAACAAAREEGRHAGVKEGQALGAKTERERTSAVLGSDEGKANMTLGAFLLGSSPDASAETIIGHLKTAPASASQAAPPAQQPSEQDRLKGALDQIPPVKTGGANAASNDGGDDGEDPNKMWDESRKRTAASTSSGMFGTVTVGGAATSVRRGG